MIRSVGVLGFEAAPYLVVIGVPPPQGQMPQHQGLAVAAPAHYSCLKAISLHVHAHADRQRLGRNLLERERLGPRLKLVLVEIVTLAAPGLPTRRSPGGSPGRFAPASGHS